MVFSFGIIGYSLLSLMKILRTFAGDFSVYYHAGQHVLQGYSLYTNISFTLFTYPPISSFFYIPFTILPFTFAQGLFVTISYACVWLSVLLTFRLLKEKPSLLFYFTTVALMLMSFPTKFTLGMGQSNLIALTLLLSAVMLDRDNKKIIAGGVLAFAIIFKPILVFLVLYFLFTRSFKTIFVCIGVGVGLVVLQIILLPSVLTSWQEYLTHVLPNLFTSQGREVYYNQGLTGALARLTTNTFVRSFFVTIGSLSLLGGVFWTLSKIKHTENFLLAVLLSVLPIIDSLSWQHHFVILLFPMTYTFFAVRKNKILLTLLFIAYVLVSYNIKHPQLFMHFGINLLLSHVFLGNILLVGVLLRSAYLQRSQGSTSKR